MVECNVNSDMHTETRAYKTHSVLNSAFRRAAETETFYHEKLFMHSHANNKAGNIKKKTTTDRPREIQRVAAKQRRREHKSQRVSEKMTEWMDERTNEQNVIAFYVSLS